MELALSIGGIVAVILLGVILLGVVKSLSARVAALEDELHTIRKQDRKERLPWVFFEELDNVRAHLGRASLENEYERQRIDAAQELLNKIQRSWKDDKTKGGGNGRANQ